jgi:putative addiction module component (TIGR02574 family)
MSETVAQILSRIDTFSQAERAELAYAFLISLEPMELGAVEAWEAELSRRVSDIRSGGAVGKPAEELFAELRGQRP